MSNFENVSVTKKANIYYDGKVTSRTIKFSDGSVKSLGIMAEGIYTFNTADKEIMEIYSGTFEIKLPTSDTFVFMQAPCVFKVEANTSFDIKVITLVDYCCSYIK